MICDTIKIPLRAIGSRGSIDYMMPNMIVGSSYGNDAVTNIKTEGTRTFPSSAICIVRITSRRSNRSFFVRPKIIIYRKTTFYNIVISINITTAQITSTTVIQSSISISVSSQLHPFLFICAGLRFVWVSLTLVDLSPRDAAAAAEEKRCGDKGFDY